MDFAPGHTDVFCVSSLVEALAVGRAGRPATSNEGDVLLATSSEPLRRSYARASANLMSTDKNATNPISRRRGSGFKF